jgi:hypothetical protein
MAMNPSSRRLSHPFVKARVVADVIRDRVASTL